MGSYVCFQVSRLLKLLSALQEGALEPAFILLLPFENFKTALQLNMRGNILFPGH